MRDNSDFLKFFFEFDLKIILEEEKSKELVLIICINVGFEDKEVVLGGINFFEDNCFYGGDVI